MPSAPESLPAYPWLAFIGLFELSPFGSPPPPPKEIARVLFPLSGVPDPQGLARRSIHAAADASGWRVSGIAGGAGETAGLVISASIERGFETFGSPGFESFSSALLLALERGGAEPILFLDPSAPLSEQARALLARREASLLSEDAPAASSAPPRRSI